MKNLIYIKNHIEKNNKITGELCRYFNSSCDECPVKKIKTRGNIESCTRSFAMLIKEKCLIEIRKAKLEKLLND